ncbi:MAG: cell envelope integrity protein CreD [Sedimentisphaerales bacterium]|nr:cell envelope integrity protein CreD [Sedimentisphaerales bacterium]
MTDIRTDAILESLKSSHFIKGILIAFVILLLQIPIMKIRGVIKEREQTRTEAIDEITAKWGKSQSVIGPTILVPYANRPSQSAYGQQQPQQNAEYATFLPESLKITGTIETQLRYRGIFEIPVYKMSLVLTGRFSRPDLSEWTTDPNQILWDQAHLSLQVSDARGMTKSPTLTWNDEPLSCLPNAGEFGAEHQGIHVKLKDHLDGRDFDFSISLELNGSIGAFFAPFGRDTEVRVTSDWPSPSFQGAWLPTDRTVNARGFDAAWNIPFLSRNFPQSWQSRSDLDQALSSSLFGVNMILPVDHYRMAQRSVKYHFLFLVLTFATIWLLEVLIKVRVHPMQYLFIGAGICLFYLLELSLAEHIGFILAYAIASAAIIALVTSYSAAVLKTNARAAIVGSVVTLLYIYLYVLLMIQDYALLIGSMGLLAVLATIMFSTRKFDWYSLTDRAVAKSLADKKMDKN